jgi:hypothetical protein
MQPGTVPHAAKFDTTSKANLIQVKSRKTEIKKWNHSTLNDFCATNTWILHKLQEATFFTHKKILGPHGNELRTFVS